MVEGEPTHVNKSNSFWRGDAMDGRVKSLELLMVNDLDLFSAKQHTW
jgi:hypothetical protein